MNQTFSGIGEVEGRAAIVRVAREYIGTPYHPGARLKGVGIDCGTLLAEVYERAGIIPHMEIPHYPPDWNKQKKDEKYLEFILRHGHLVPFERVKPGDVAVWKFALSRSHGAIIVNWPVVIHATLREDKVWQCNVTDHLDYAGLDPIFFSFWA